MEPQIQLRLSLGMVNAALNALEQQGQNANNAIAAIKGQAVAQMQAQQPQMSLPELDPPADIVPAPI